MRVVVLNQRWQSETYKILTSSHVERFHRLMELFQLLCVAILSKMSFSKTQQFLSHFYLCNPSPRILLVTPEKDYLFIRQ